jgi:putative transposase
VLKEYGIASSMSRKGDRWNDARSETLFGSLKVERLHGQRFTLAFDLNGGVGVDDDC